MLYGARFVFLILLVLVVALTAYVHRRTLRQDRPNDV